MGKSINGGMGIFKKFPIPPFSHDIVISLVAFALRLVGEVIEVVDEIDQAGGKHCLVGISFAGLVLAGT
ncbi:hypothetical protein DSUL_20037 [Desulfovibrionales bacterium]